MRHLFFLAAFGVSVAVLGAPRTEAQTFPEPGTGVYSWRTVGDRPISAVSLDFGPDSTLYAGTSGSAVVALIPPTPDAPAGTWRVLPGNPGFGNDAILALSSDTLLASNFSATILTRSTDSGATWTVANGCSTGCATGGPRRPGGFLMLPPGHPHAGRILAGGGIGDIGPIYSDDRGATWLVATNQGGGGAYPYDFALLPSGRVLAARSGVYATDDGGARYTRTALGVSSEGVTALATPGSTQAAQASGDAPSCGQADTSLCDGAVAFGSGGDGVAVWWTNDGGRSWSAPVALPQPFDGVSRRFANAVALPPGPDGLGRAVAVLGRGLVYTTSDGGQSWQIAGRMPLDLSVGAESARYVRLGPDGHLWVLASTAGNQPYPMYRSVEPAEVAFPVASEAPPQTGETRIRIEPNPSSMRASVRVALDAATEARIVVVDALGRQVAMLHDGPLAAGERTFTLDTSALPAGVYVVRASGSSLSEARTFTVVR